jgi:hypothetical protein
METGKKEREGKREVKLRSKICTKKRTEWGEEKIRALLSLS